MINLDDKQERPKVGIGVFVIRDDKILLGKRKNAHGAGSWCPPGGHLEFNESWEDCATREVQEETGLHVTNLRFGTATNNIFRREHKHYVTIFIVADYVDGEPRVMESDKCEVWDWFTLDALPAPLFATTQTVLANGFDPFAAAPVVTS